MDAAVAAGRAGVSGSSELLVCATGGSSSMMFGCTRSGEALASGGGESP